MVETYYVFDILERLFFCGGNILCFGKAGFFVVETYYVLERLEIVFFCGGHILSFRKAGFFFLWTLNIV